MNIKNRIDTGEYTINEIVEWLDTRNPTILYSLISVIVKDNINDSIIIKKLLELTKKTTNQDKILGYYKIGHLAMSTLLKLDFSYSDIIMRELDSFEKEMTLRFFEENEW